MKHYSCLFIILVLIVAVIAGCSSNKDAVSQSISVKESTETKIVKHPKTVNEEILAQIEKLNDHIKEIKLPSWNNNFYLLPTSTATYSEEEGFSLTLRLEQREATEDKLSGLPLNVIVNPYSDSTYNEYNNYVETEFNGKKFLVHPDPKKSEIVFVADDYIYNMNSSSFILNKVVYLFSVQELMTISSSLDKASEYKEFLRIGVSNYAIPTYFANSKKDKISIMVSYSNVYGFHNFNIEEQELIIRNQTMQLYETNGTNPEVNDVLLNEGYDGNYSQIEADSVVGYLNHSEPYQLVSETKGGIQIYIKPASEVNETTGKVWTKEVPNWDEEAKRTFISLFDGAESSIDGSKAKQKDNVMTENNESPTTSQVFTIRDNNFSLYGITIGASPSEIKSTLGTPDYEGVDETGFYEWVQQYEQNNILVSFYSDQVDSYFVEVGLKELERSIKESFQGEKYINEEGTKYLYIPESEQLLMYSEKEDDPSIVNVSVMYADGNFHYWLENGGIKKYY